MNYRIIRFFVQMIKVVEKNLSKRFLLGKTTPLFLRIGIFVQFSRFSGERTEDFET